MHRDPAWVGSVSWCWELTLRNEDGLERGAERVHRREERRVCHQGLSPGTGDGGRLSAAKNKPGRLALGTGGRVETDPLAGGAGVPRSSYGSWQL